MDSSAAAIAAQGLLRLGKHLSEPRYFQAGLKVAKTLFAEPCLAVDPAHQGLFQHSVYHRPGGWDHIPPGNKVPAGEATMWGDYHAREAGMWRPARPITIIVPQGAGGSTDQVTRVVAGELEYHLGQKILIVNQGGASGSVVTKGCLDAPHDGYMWTAGAAADLGAYKVRGLLETTLDDWVLYLSVANVSVISVHSDTPYQDFGDLLEAFKARPGQIPVATAGQLSAGHNAMVAIQKYTGIEYKHMTYDGWNPAVVATVAGECEAVPQLAVEEADMLAGGKLRALAVLDDKPLELKGYGTIPPITDWIPDFAPAPN